MSKWKINLASETRSLENPAVPLWSPAAYNYLGAPRSSSGVAIDRQTVLGYPAVWRALNLVSHKIGRLPLSVYRRNKDGGREEDTEHPAYWLLSRRPSDLYTPFTFKSTMIAHALLHGNSFAWILRDDVGRPEELVILNPEQTGVAVNRGQVTYYVRMGMDTRTILPENVLHIKGLGHDGLVGYSVLDCLREAFGLGLAAQRYGSVFFRNNGSPGPMILTFPAGVKLDKEQQQQLREQIDQLHGGLDNAHRPMILANGGAIGNFKIDNNTAQFLQTREFEVAAGIANIFGIPAHKLGVPRNSSYNSLESEERAFLFDTLDGWLVAFEEECESKLLKESQQVRDSHFVEFDRRSLEQADYKTRSESLIAEVNNGLRTLNEARALLNLPSIGEDGDRLRQPVNITFTDLLPEEGEVDSQVVKDVALTDDPNPPAEQTAGPTSGKSPTKDDPVDGQPVRLKALLASVVRRWLVRAGKAAEAASRRPDWRTWLESGLDEHRGVLVEGIAPASPDPEKAANAMLGALREELSAVLPEQAGTVFERISPEAWAETILENNHE